MKLGLILTIILDKLIIVQSIEIFICFVYQQNMDKICNLFNHYIDIDSNNSNR